MQTLSDGPLGLKRKVVAMTNNKNSLRVLHNSDGGWDLRWTGSQQAISHHSTQAEAINQGRQIAIMYGAELFIHGRNGTIRDRDSYGNDPFPPRDTKF